MGADFIRTLLLTGSTANRGNPRGLISYERVKGLDPFTNFPPGPFGEKRHIHKPPQTPMDVHNWEAGFFFQDDWKATSRRDGESGLRYELVTPFIDNHDLLANFDPKFCRFCKWASKGRFVFPSDRTRQFLDTRILTQFTVVECRPIGLEYWPRARP